jgi:hypothetical protein
MKSKKTENEKQLSCKNDIADWENIEIVKEEDISSKNNKNKISISDEFLMNDDWESNEEIYKEAIVKESWIKDNKYINIDKIKNEIPSFHYLDKHCTILESALPEKTLENLYKDSNFFSQPNTKKIIRKGISPKYLNRFILKLFDIKDIDKSVYNNKFTIIFKNHDTKNLEDFVPYFSEKKTLKECLPLHYLNEKGIEELKILLWMISDTYRNITYCPILMKLISILLIFCDKYETFEVICKLIDEDKKLEEDDEYKLNWRLKFTYEDNKKLILSIKECLKEMSPKNRSKYYSILEKFKINQEEIYKDMCFNLFLNHLNFYGIIRLLPFYLKEGVKCFYRLIFAFEQQICEQNIVINNKSEVIETIRKLCKKINDIPELFNIAIKFNVTSIFNNKFLIQKAESNDILSNKNNDYYLPFFKGGNLLTDYEIIHLWEILPFEYKIKNASLIYQASKDGYNLPNIIEMEEKYNKKTNILLLIETMKGDKFGFISSDLIMHTDNQYYRPSSSFLFSIRPKFELYTPIDSDEILYVTTKDFIFGNGPNGPAIQLNQDLKEGDSYGGGCFNNPSLVSDPDGHFSVRKLEIFKLE